jgi:TonB family protein
MKIRTAPNIFFTLFFVLGFCTLSFSQTNPSTAPVNWVKYKVEAIKVSFLMPKLPVVVNESNYCRGEQSFAYGSYADGVGYVVRITRKIDVPLYCTEKKEFDKTNFENRIQALKNTPLALKERETDKSKPNEIILEGNKQIYKLINNPKKDGWIEFLVVGADENKPAVKNFLDSLQTDKKSNGIEIGDGAERTLGDEPIKKDEIVKKDTEKPILQGQGNGDGNSTVTPKPETSSNNSTAEGVRIVLKPRANYTDQARNGQTQGKVLLRVVFSANGGIGAISVISGLENGLTEQAIVAAKRIVFIPASRNGIRYSVVKPVEYNFTIY